MCARRYLAALTLLVWLPACQPLGPRPDPTPPSSQASQPALTPTSSDAGQPAPAPTASEASQPELTLVGSCRASMDGLRALWRDLRLPAHYQSEDQAVRQAGDFDPNQYFQVFTHLRPAPGYMLDYVYYQSGLGGLPILYARLEDGPTFKSRAELESAVEGGDWLAYLQQIQVDGTPAGYLEYVILSQLGNQFYLSWHAYINDTQVLCDHGDLAVVTQHLAFYNQSLPAEKVRQLETLDFSPAVVIAGDTVTVRIVIFTKWGGFFERIYQLDKTHLGRPVETQDNRLVPYDCGIVF